MERLYPCIVGLLTSGSSNHSNQIFLPQSPLDDHNYAMVSPTNILSPPSSNTSTCITKSKNKMKKNHVQHCAGSNCGNNRFDNPDLSFFRFPKAKERCKKWVLNTRRKDGIIKKSAAQLFRGSVLCEQHFEKSQFK